MREEYRPIEGYERYSVSNTGKVVNNQTGRELAQRLTTNGYLRVNLRTGKEKYEKPHSVCVHRLVASAFLPKRDSSLVVNHIDANKQNNSVKNLEWCTPRESSIHAYRTLPEYAKACNANMKKAQKLSRKAICVFLNGRLMGEYDSMVKAAEATGVNKKTIYNGLHGMKSRKGYEFRLSVSGGD